MEKGEKEFMRKTVIAAAVLFGVIYAVSIAVTSLSSPATAESSIDAAPMTTGVAYFPDQFVNQGANEAEIYIQQF